MAGWWAETFANIGARLQPARAALSGQQPATGNLAAAVQRVRANTANVSAPSGVAMSPNNFYDTLLTKSDDVEFDPGNNNAITIPVTDWWTFTISVVCRVGIDANEGIAAAIFQEGAIVALNTMPWSQSDGFVSQGSHLLYCTAGDIIQPGYYADGSGLSLSGDPGGFLTHFAGAPLGRGIN